MHLPFGRIQYIMLYRYNEILYYMYKIIPKQINFRLKNVKFRTSTIKTNILPIRSSNLSFFIYLFNLQFNTHDLINDESQAIGSITNLIKYNILINHLDFSLLPLKECSTYNVTKHLSRYYVTTACLQSSFLFCYVIGS